VLCFWCQCQALPLVIVRVNKLQQKLSKTALPSSCQSISCSMRSLNYPSAYFLRPERWPSAVL
jgi:hypothetical protein